MSVTHRQAAVAGQFYPLESKVLQSEINQYLSQVSKTEAEECKAIIVPHAGYIYSGSIAASAYTKIQHHPGSISTVILLGPAHRVAFNGIAISSAKYFNTPLGDVVVNQTLNDKIAHFPFVHCNDEAHFDEHSLEVQLPFLQSTLDNFTIVPLLIGNCDSNDVATIIDYLWGGRETLIIVSSDLSHFNDYQTASKIDTNTSQAILNLDPDNIHYQDACGRIPVNALLKIAKQKKLTVKILDVRNSGDTAGDKLRVVGYGAYSFINSKT